MSQTGQPRQPAPPDESEKGGHMMNEPDIGSGEKTPGEQETDEQIRQIAPARQDGAGQPGKS